MVFFDVFLEFGKLAGTLAFYRSMYNEYDDESLVDEFYTLWKRKNNYISSDEEDLKYLAIKGIIDERRLFEFD